MMNNAVQNDFIQRINDVYRECYGFQNFGSTTEFYDEDGVVLMAATQESPENINFAFADDENFDFITQNGGADDAFEDENDEEVRNA